MLRYLFAILFLVVSLAPLQAQQPTPRDILKLALGVSDAQLSKVYETWGKILGTKDVSQDTVWRWQPKLVTIDGNTVLDSVRVAHNIIRRETPRPAYAYEILSHWRSQTIDTWKAERKKAVEDSLNAVVKQAVSDPTF